MAGRQVDAALIQSVLSGMTADPRTGRVSTATVRQDAAHTRTKSDLYFTHLYVARLPHFARRDPPTYRDTDVDADATSAAHLQEDASGALAPSTLR